MGKNIIFYFSGTGNSLIAARKIAGILGDTELASIPDSLNFDLTGYERIGFIYPVYFRGVPLVVKQFVESLDFSTVPTNYLFSVATCGGSPGSGLKELNTLLFAKGRSLDYGTLLNMGGNYILMYGKPDKADAANEQADRELTRIATEICDKSKRPCGKSNWISAFPTELFRKNVHKTAREYTVSDECVSCGLCVRVCPVHNIELKGDKPTFGDHCEQCMACIQWCPPKAINYKGKTANRKRYHHPAITVNDMIHQHKKEEEMFRLGTINELELIKDIAFKAYFPYVEIIGKRPAPLDENYLEKIEEGALHVLLVNNEIVGFLIVYLVDGNLLIENVAVDPAHHGKGFGSKLMRFAENLAVREKAKTITLYTNAQMTKNIQIYIGMGYIVTHKSEWNGLNRVHMSKGI